MKIGSTSLSPVLGMSALARTNRAIANSLQRLASGSRILSAADDPAGAAAITRLNADLRSSDRALLNLNEAMGLVATADSGLSAQQDILRSMRELVLQGSNSSLSLSDRSQIDTQLKLLTQQLGQIASSTTFGDLHLLDGSLPSLQIQTGANAGDTISVGMVSSTLTQLFQETRGAGQFNAAITAATGGSASDIKIGDIDGDGYQDVVVGSGSMLQVFWGNGAGIFNQVTTISGTGSFIYEVAFGDIDGDGKPDLASSGSGGSFVFRNNGGRSFTAIPNFQPVAGYTDVALKDLNGDGLADLISSGNGTSIAISNGDGTFTPAASVDSGGNGLAAYGDINGDGKLDIISPSYGTNTLVVALGNGNGTFKTPMTQTTIANLSWIALGDFNEDGKADFVGGNGGSNTGSIYLGAGNGTFTLAQTFDTGAAAEKPAVSDMNGDGHADILMPVRNGYSLILYGNGRGTFSAPNTVNDPGIYPYSIGAVDWNHDGAMDIVTSNSFWGGGPSTVSIDMQKTVRVNATSSLSVSNTTVAGHSLALIDQALDTVIRGRAQIGAAQSRLDFSYNALTLTRDAKSSALSTMSDVDIALEVAELTRQQILQRAQVAVLAQANSQMSIVLKLLASLRDHRR